MFFSFLELLHVLKFLIFLYYWKFHFLLWFAGENNMFPKYYLFFPSNLISFLYKSRDVLHSCLDYYTLTKDYLTIIIQSNACSVKIKTNRKNIFPICDFLSSQHHIIFHNFTFCFSRKIIFFIILLELETQTLPLSERKRVVRSRVVVGSLVLFFVAVGIFCCCFFVQRWS